MRLLSLILSLAAIVWVMYQASGGGETTTMIPESHMEAMHNARGLEQSLQDTARQRLEELDQQ